VQTNEKKENEKNWVNPGKRVGPGWMGRKKKTGMKGRNLKSVGKMYHKSRKKKGVIKATKKKSGTTQKNEEGELRRKGDRFPKERTTNFSKSGKGTCLGEETTKVNKKKRKEEYG